MFSSTRLPRMDFRRGGRVPASAGARSGLSDRAGPCFMYTRPCTHASGQGRAPRTVQGTHFAPADGYRYHRHRRIGQPGRQGDGVRGGVNLAAFMDFMDFMLTVTV